MRLLKRIKELERKLKPEKIEWDIYINGFNAKGEPCPEDGPVWIITTNPVVPEIQMNYRENTRADSKIVTVGVDWDKI